MKRKERNKMLNKIIYIGFKEEMGRVKDAKSDLNAGVVLHFKRFCCCTKVEQLANINKER